MKPRTFARSPSSIGSNQLSKRKSSASPPRSVVVFFVMAWSPVRRSNAGISRVEHPGDYATPNSNHLRDGTHSQRMRDNHRGLYHLLLAAAFDRGVRLVGKSQPSFRRGSKKLGNHASGKNRKLAKCDS